MVIGGNFVKEGAGALTVGGNVTISGEMDVAGAGVFTAGATLSYGSRSLKMTPTSATYEIITAHPEYTEKLVVPCDLNLTSISGGGTLESDVDQTITVSSSATETFYGTLTGAMGLVKEGAGTLELQGPSTFTGDVAINGGTLALTQYDYDNAVNNTVRYDFDSSDTNTLKFVSGSETQIQGNNKGSVYYYRDGSDYAELGSYEGIFGGRPVMYLNGASDYGYDGGNDGGSRSYIYVLRQPEDVAVTMDLLYIWHSSNRGRCDWISLVNGWWVANTYNSGGKDWALFLDGYSGSARTATANKESILSVTAMIAFGNGYKEGFGRIFNGYIAQAIGFQEVISIEERRAIETYLMKKWTLDDADNFNMIPPTANVTMASGAALDLGGVSHTVASFTGAGNVYNGYLRTADSKVTITGNLDIPAADGTTYVFAAGSSGTVLSLDGEASELVVDASAITGPVRVQTSMDVSNFKNIILPSKGSWNLAKSNDGFRIMKGGLLISIR